MKIVAIRNLIRKDLPIYYRKLFTGVVVIDFMGNSTDYRIEFSIEYKPTGEKEISITFLDALDYPLVTVNNMLKRYIHELDSSDELPD